MRAVTGWALGARHSILDARCSSLDARHGRQLPQPLSLPLSLSLPLPRSLSLSLPLPRNGSDYPSSDDVSDFA